MTPAFQRGATVAITPRRWRAAFRTTDVTTSDDGNTDTTRDEKRESSSQPACEKHNFYMNCQLRSTPLPPAYRYRNRSPTTLTTIALTHRSYLPLTAHRSYQPSLLPPTYRPSLLPLLALTAHRSYRPSLLPPIALTAAYSHICRRIKHLHLPYCNSV